MAAPPHKNTPPKLNNVGVTTKNNKSRGKVSKYFSDYRIADDKGRYLNLALQFKFFCIPVGYETDHEDELNHFLRKVRVLNISRDLISQNDKNYWAITIEHTTEKDAEWTKYDYKRKIDYKEILTPENFKIYSKLRDWRKETATREATQVYTVFLNEHLAAMVEKKVTTVKGLLEIDGIGNSKVEKYGAAVLDILKKEFSDKGAEQ
ncbi:MAG: HRDC domain-containing protein [Deltaproteobacteria bacterium]|nr:HRDC domain-containing protein [Deltaproteobacteria bacterium]